MPVLFSMNANFNILYLNKKIYEAFALLPYLKKTATNVGRRSILIGLYPIVPRRSDVSGFIPIELDASLFLYEC